MIRWLTSDLYSPYDLVWMTLCARALWEGEYLAALVAIVIGALSSGALTVLARKGRTPGVRDE